MRLSHRSWSRVVLALVAISVPSGRGYGEDKKPPEGRPPEAPRVTVEEQAETAALVDAQAAAERIAAKERAWVARYDLLVKHIRDHTPGKFDVRLEGRTAMGFRECAEGLLEDGKILVSSLEVIQKESEPLKKALGDAPRRFEDAAKEMRAFAKEETFESIKKRYILAAETWEGLAADARARKAALDSTTSSDSIEFVRRLNLFLARYLPVVRIQEDVTKVAGHDDIIEQLNQFKMHHEQLLKALEEKRNRVLSRPLDPGLRAEQAQKKHAALALDLERESLRLLSHYPSGSPLPAYKARVLKNPDWSCPYKVGDHIQVYDLATFKPVRRATIAAMGSHELYLESKSGDFPPDLAHSSLVLLTPKGEERLRQDGTVKLASRTR